MGHKQVYKRLCVLFSKKSSYGVNLNCLNMDKYCPFLDKNPKMSKSQFFILKCPRNTYTITLVHRKCADSLRGFLLLNTLPLRVFFLLNTFHMKCAQQKKPSIFKCAKQKTPSILTKSSLSTSRGLRWPNMGSHDILG